MSGNITMTAADREYTGSIPSLLDTGTLVVDSGSGNPALACAVTVTPYTSGVDFIDRPLTGGFTISLVSPGLWDVRLVPPVAGFAAAAAALTAVLDGLTYQNKLATRGASTRLVKLETYDQGPPIIQGTATRTINVHAQSYTTSGNISMTAAARIYPSGTAPLTVDTGTLVAATSGNPVLSATVTISGYQAGTDVLAIPAGAGYTVAPVAGGSLLVTLVPPVAVMATAASAMTAILIQLTYQNLGTTRLLGTKTITITTSDASQFQGIASRDITVYGSPIVIAPATLPTAILGQAYTQTLVASYGGGAPYTYAIVAGALPVGLTLSTGGGITGAPVAAGVTSFTVRATDSLALTPSFGDQVYTITTINREGIEMPLPILTDQEWSGVSLKAMVSAEPNGVYYDHGWTSGVARLWVTPVPTDTTLSLVLYTPEALRDFADLATVYTFPPGYRRFLRTNLLVELAGDYGKVLSQQQVDDAKDARAKVKRGNIRPVELRLDNALTWRTGLRIGAWDWRTGNIR